MNMSNKIITNLLSIGIAFSGIALATPSFAGGKHHHGGHGNHPGHGPHHGGGGGGHRHHNGGGHHNGGYQPHYKRHNGDMGVALGVGALFGALAMAAADHPQEYYADNCYRYRVVHRCHYTAWGDEVCRTVRYERNICT